MCSRKIYYCHKLHKKAIKNSISQNIEINKNKIKRNKKKLSMNMMNLNGNVEFL